MARRKTKKSNKQRAWDKVASKWVICYKCNINEVEISEDAVRGICWRCCQRLVGPPHNLEKKKKGPKKPRGWHFMAEFVDSEGNVFHKGKEQPDLKGTLPPTKVEKKKPKKKKLTSTFHEEKKKLERISKRKKIKK